MPAHFLINIRANACLKLSWVLETYQRGLIWEKDQSNNNNFIFNQCRVPIMLFSGDVFALFFLPNKVDLAGF